MHTVAHMLSKPSLFPLLITFLFCFSLPALLPALISSPFHLGKGLRAQRQREQARRKEGAATRGHEKGEETRRKRRVGRLIWDDAHTQEPLFGRFAAGPCDHEYWRLMNVWPLAPPFISSCRSKAGPSSYLSSWAAPVPHRQEISTWMTTKNPNNLRHYWTPSPTAASGALRGICEIFLTVCLLERATTGEQHVKLLRLHVLYVLAK